MSGIAAELGDFNIKGLQLGTQRAVIPSGGPEPLHSHKLLAVATPRLQLVVGLSGALEGQRQELRLNGLRLCDELATAFGRLRDTVAFMDEAVAMLS